MNKHFALCVALIGASAGTAGCSSTARYVTAEHWHDDNTFFIAYTEYNKTSYVVTSSGTSTAHVMMCRAGSDNTATCRAQTAVDRLLNPDEVVQEAPAAPAPAAVEPAPAAEPAAAPAPVEPQS